MAFLEGGFQTPPLHEIEDNLLSCLALIGGKQRLWRALALRITSEQPTDGQGIRAIAIPESRGSADLHNAFAFPIPIHRDALPHRLGVMQDRLERWQAFSNHTRTTNRVLGTHFGRLVDHRVQAKRSDQCHVLSDTMQSQFQNTVGSISYQLDRHVGKPTTQETYHLMCPHTYRLVAFSQLLADFRGRCQDTQKGQGPTLLGPRQRDHYGHDDPA